jgi:uncharacterized protein YndB with AHSA1/START domain
MNTQPFTIERTLNAPVERVWTAITDKDQMREWYFDVSAFKAEPGFEFQFTGTSKEDTTYLHKCKVTEVVPGRRLTYSWRYEGYEGNSFVTFELFPEGDKTRIRLTHEGLESFPKHPDFGKTNFAQGWTHIIGTSLPAFMERELVK